MGGAARVGLRVRVRVRARDFRDMSLYRLPKCPFRVPQIFQVSPIVYIYHEGHDLDSGPCPSPIMCPL